MIAMQTPSMEGLQNMACEAVQQTKEAVKENPGLSMLVVFGVGAGIGALLGEALHYRLTPRPLSTAERIGQQICEALNIKMT